MKVNLLKERDSKLLNRERKTFEVLFTGKTPSKQELKESISKGLKIDKGLVSIKHIYQRFGSGKAKVITNIYKNKEDFERFEKTKEKKKDSKKEKKEQPKQEKPKEEKKQTAKEEKPQEKTEQPKQEVKQDGKEKETKEQAA